MRFRRLLKDGTTGLYYAKLGDWTANDGEALDFPDTFAAVHKAVKLGKKELHLILKFADSRLDISHALGEIAPGSHSRNAGQSAGVLLLALFPVANVAGSLFGRISD
ncbi:MAG: hypothetical protein JWM16_2042 [Verrucomicrobiales bacterium]|nr:hypothetical protein [Verrucomicrobiales bacterium]